MKCTHVDKYRKGMNENEYLPNKRNVFVYVLLLYCEHIHSHSYLF